MSLMKQNQFDAQDVIYFKLMSKRKNRILTRIVPQFKFRFLSIVRKTDNWSHEFKFNNYKQRNCIIN